MSEKSDPGYTPDRFGHIWVHTGAPDDDMAWCKHCSVGIDQPAARARCGEPWVINHGEQVSESQDDGTELLDDNDYPGEDEPRLTGHPPDPNGPDGEIDMRVGGDGWTLTRGTDGGYLIEPRGWLDERQVLALANTLLSEIEMGQRDPVDDPEFPWWDWYQAVAQGATRRSYQHWVEAQREQAEYDAIPRGDQ